MTFLILSVLLLLCFLIAFGLHGQYRRFRTRYEILARELCDEGSWTVKFYLRLFVLRGRIVGHPIRYSVFGDLKGSTPSSSYFLLEYPVKRDFRFYAGSDPDLVEPAIRAPVAILQQVPDFKGLTVTSDHCLLLAKWLSRPFGLGHRPGVLFWKWGPPSFDPVLLRHEFDLLIDLVEKGV